MGNDLDIRLRADRLFVEYLCAATGRSASALASGANVASTTLNRFISKKVKPNSTLKDSTIEKIARRWGLDYLELAAYRKAIADALRAGKAPPDFAASFGKAKPKTGLRETVAESFLALARDPLMDKIMGATYDVWFHSDYHDIIALDHLPDLVRLLYKRIKPETPQPNIRDIRKRALDVLAATALGKK